MATILVVDDHPTNREFLVTLLGYAGHRLLEAADGAEALEVVRAERPDLVVVDLVMSTMDGYEFVRQLRTDPTIAHTRVMFWTAAYQQSEAWNLAQSCGVQHILTKPTEPEAVLKTVAEALTSGVPFDQPFSSEKFHEDHLQMLTDKLFTQVQALECEVEKRKQAEEMLQQTNKALEVRVQERTAELEQVNRELQADIVARIQADEARRESEERYRIITQALSDYAFCFRVDMAGAVEIEWLTDSFTKTTGYTFEELKPKPFSLYVHPDDIARVSQIQWMMKSEGPIVTEFRIITKGGDLRWVRSYIQKVPDKEGRFVRVYGAAQDITARKRAEEKFRGLLESAPDAMVIVNKQGEIVLINSQTQQLFGYIHDELLGKPVEVLVPKRFQINHAEHRVNYFMEPHVRLMGAGMELYGLRKDGSEFPVEISLSPLETEEGRLVSSTIRDVTSRKRAEEALRASESKYRLLVEQASDGICIVDRHGHFVEVNPSLCDMLGYNRIDLMRLTIEAIIPPEDVHLSPLRYNKQQPAKKTILREHRLRRKDGSLFSVEISARRLTEACTQATIRDITERKQLEAQLALARKLESIGQLAAGIAHELNTPLQYVGDNVQFLQDAYKGLGLLLQKHERLLEAATSGAVPAALLEEVQATASTPYNQYLVREIPKATEQSMQGVEHVSKIVCALREFSHPGSEEKSVIDLNRAITTTITISRNVWKYVADVVTEFDPHLPPVPGFPGELNQAILNLIVNAAHAIEEVVNDDSTKKGTITISTKHADDWATVRIHDTGPGIPEAIRSRIFDPFFTTKKVGKGTGQGLAIVYSVIVEKHGGTITLETEVGQGATFILRLPLCSSASPSQEISHEKIYSLCG